MAFLDVLRAWLCGWGPGDVACFALGAFVLWHVLRVERALAQAAERRCDEGREQGDGDVVEELP